MKTILITGAGGYIGSVATSVLLSKGYAVVALDNFSTGFMQALKLLKKKYGAKMLRVYKVDLAGDLTEVFDKEKKIDAVLHYAAKCSVNESMEYPEKYFENNTCATTNFLGQLLKNKIKNLVFSSTCAVYGEAVYMPLDERHPTEPANPYGESKLMSEKIIEWYSKIHDLHYVILRYFNVCGATDDGMIGDSKNPSPHLMQNAVRGALGIEPFNLTCGKFDTTDGTPIRDYVNVVDLADAHILAVEYLLNGGENEIINIGTGEGNSVLEIVDQVQEITGESFELAKTEARKGEYAKMIAATDKAKRTLGWVPKHTLKDSVQSLVKWYTTNPNGWKK